MDSVMRDIEQVQEDRRRIPYTRNLRLVFSLINEDISAGSEGTRKDMAGVRGWEGREVELLFKKRFSPLLKALAGTQSFYKELQTTWFAPLQFDPKLLEVEREREPPVEVIDDDRLNRIQEERLDDEREEEEEVDGLDQLSTAIENDSTITLEDGLIKQPKREVDNVHLIDWEDIKIFVNSGEWSLTSGAITSPLSSVNSSAVVGTMQDMSDLFEQTERTLHFVLYVPKPSHRPLRIAGDVEASTISHAKGWLIPQWGGVALFNLGFEKAESASASSGGLPNQGRMLDSLSAVEMNDAFLIFEKQINTLLGLQEWEVTGVAEETSLALRLDALTRRRIVAASRESVKTLGSIIRLVDKIENLGVGQSVRDDVSRALLLLEEVGKERGRKKRASPPPHFLTILLPLFLCRPIN